MVRLRQIEPELAVEFLDRTGFKLVRRESLVARRSDCEVIKVFFKIVVNDLVCGMNQEPLVGRSGVAFVVVHVCQKAPSVLQVVDGLDQIRMSSRHRRQQC